MEIINTSSDETPRDGKVKVSLKAQVRDSAGKPAKLGRITGWSIDGNPHLDPRGRPIVDPEFAAQLTPGTHRVEVSGTDADGKPVQAAAKIDVQIKSTVGISPAR